MSFSKRVSSGQGQKLVCQQGYEACKQGLTGDVLLVHYNENRELILLEIHPAMGFQKLLAIVVDNEKEWQIAYASRTCEFE